MHRRPLNAMFNTAVLNDIKFTTIRDKPWPVDVPIMFYNWSGAPYRSKQIDVCVVKTIIAQPIYISKQDDGSMIYDYPCSWPLWQGEGFLSQEQMDFWFSPLVKTGKPLEKHIMRFCRLTEDELRELT